jgi:predicted anti-sigma-YlaC factor YlaD
MRCTSARRLINDSLDGALRPDRAADLTKHLAGCPACRAFARDLESIVGQAGKLPGLEPSGRVWQKIVSGIRTPRIEEAVRPARAFGWRYALAAASALVIIGSGLFIGLQYRRAAVPPGVPERGTAAFTIVKLKEAQVYYEKAIGALSEAVRSQESGLEPGLADVFERNLAGLDRTIQVCRQMVDRNPDNPVLRAHLLTAYREKVNLFEEIVGVGRAPGNQLKPTTL